MKVLVTGGYFDDGGDGVVWEIDLTLERAEVLLRWSPPSHLHVPTKGFAGGCLTARHLYVAAHAALVRIDLRRAAVDGVLHQPCMNDLHHVASQGEHLFVSNTGLGAIEVFHLDGHFLGSHALLPAWANARRINGSDPDAPPLTPGWSGGSPPAWPKTSTQDNYYSQDRRGRPFHQQKVPDHLHVNHVSFVDGRPFATCFADGSLRDLADFSVAWRDQRAFIHDGVASGGSLWLTAIDGSLIELDATTFEERRRLNCFETGHYGWCRGLAVTTSHLLVGLTEVRPGRLPKHRWADRDPRGSETSVLLLDRRDGRLLARVNVSDPTRHSKLYSILPDRSSAGMSFGPHRPQE